MNQLLLLDQVLGINVSNDPYGVATPVMAPLEQCMPPAADMPQGDIGADIAALVVLNANQSEAAARQLQKSEEAMEEANNQREINAMHAEANLKMAAGILSVSTSAVGAGLSAVGAGSAGSTLQSLGGGVGQMLQAEATNKAADEKSFANQAQAEQRGADASKDVADDAKKLADKAIDFYQQWTQAKNTSAEAATHRT